MTKFKYAKITVEGKNIPDDEPRFLLRGQDILASAAVRYYATLVAAAGNPSAAKEIMAYADMMDQWPIKKYPD